MRIYFIAKFEMWSNISVSQYFILKGVSRCIFHVRIRDLHIMSLVQRKENISRKVPCRGKKEKIKKALHEEVVQVN